jgi:hypothetical protein
MNRAVVASYTARTTAFATATAITDTTILNALNTFDLGLISNGLATKMKALYPFVGGTATTHKFNFMDARDLNAAFRLQLNGGWTHSANGIQGNGVNTYADTYFKCDTNYSNFNLGGFGNYYRTNESGAYADGCSGFAPFWILPRFIDGTTQFQSGGSVASVSTANSLGFILGSNYSSTSRKLIKNGTVISTNTNTTLGPANTNIFIGAGGNGGIYPGSKNYAMSVITEGMTDTDQSNLYTLTQALQTSLSRQV